ncbi:DUF1120 domain-containing protein [Achromobacter piechaudii]|uniref:Protein GltF n=1 Tax=Achromobacter piechaudii TaxID=72556 RepID=A0ABM8KT03_9BURK|nr:DUF1120 domain-containing protein [Achromobacter piechaudii]CAB3651402.1 hypothetical protein LMG1873_00079 [Achromobacter piechaudii]CAB3814585.1 hypothetical protein LMG2828_00079 [Achromobacter piechaudii]CAB3946577.1 hypothetical protein LMG6103_01653 [Achromobacter piechaudii]
MTKILSYLCAGLALSTATLAHAADGKANLSIKGQLIPPACNIGLDQVGPVDYGDIPFNTLDVDGKLLDELQPNMKISCGGPTRVSFTLQENRPGTAITQQEATAAGMKWPYQHPGNGTRHAWGLGTVQGTKIGALVLLIRPHASEIDGKAPTLATSYVIARPIGSASKWPIHSAQETINLNPIEEYSFGTTEAVVPITTASLSLGIKPLLNRPAVLPSQEAIVIDGSVTFTLRYL